MMKGTGVEKSSEGSGRPLPLPSIPTSSHDPTSTGIGETRPLDLTSIERNSKFGKDLAPITPRSDQGEVSETQTGDKKKKTKERKEKEEEEQ
jgi:hypothetical protein